MFPPDCSEPSGWLLDFFQFLHPLPLFLPQFYPLLFQPFLLLGLNQGHPPPQLVAVPYYFPVNQSIAKISAFTNHLI